MVRPAEVHEVQVYELVRRSVLRDGKSVRQVARDLGINRRSVSKMLREPLPPGYRLKVPRERPVLGPYMSVIEELVGANADEPVRQRRTARQIFETLRKDHGYMGGYTQVKAYVAEVRGKPREAFLPLTSIPGEAEADFYEVVAEIAGERLKVHAFVMLLPHSGVWFSVCYPVENGETFADGHVQAFRFFGGAVSVCVYDNAGYSVKRGSGPIKGRERNLTESFAQLQSVFLFRAEFARPARGNEKGAVERKIGTLKRSFWAPAPKAASFAELNRMLLEKAQADKEANAQAFVQDSARLLSLPDYESSRMEERRVDKLGLVRFETCSYSVPTELVGRSLSVRATPFLIEILDRSAVVARHARCYQKGRIVTDLLHYLNLLEYKPRAVHSALPVVQAGLPAEFEAFRRRVVDGTTEGDKRFVGILLLLKEHPVDIVAEALRVANARGIREPSDVRCLLLRSSDKATSAMRTDWKLSGGASGPVVERPALDRYNALTAVTN